MWKKSRGIMNKLIRNYLLSFFFLAGVSAPVFAVRYVDVSSVSNVPIVRVKNVEDFESIIDGYKIPVVYRVIEKNERNSYANYDTVKTLFVITGGTYFSFNIHDYDTLDDYKFGSSLKFETAKDFYEARKLGIETSELYYWYSGNHFRSVDDFNDAYRKGFFKKKSEDYYKAKELGYTSYEDYKVYCDYTKAGFKSKEEWKNAQKLGFSSASSYNQATDAGFSTYSEYNEAYKLKLHNDKNSYDYYKSITNSVDEIVEKNKLNKNEAFVFVLLQSLPKGEMSISVLSTRLQDMINQKPEVRDAFEKFIFGNSSRNSYGGNNINYSLKPSGLLKFFSSVDISKIGSYDNKTEIFKKK